MPRSKLLFAVILLAGFSFFQCSCRNVRIKNRSEWKQYFHAYPAIGDACFEMYDNNKEIAMYFNKKRCSERLTPGAEFDIFNAMAALSANVALDDQFKLAVKDSTKTTDTLTLTQAFKQGNGPYFQQLAQVVGMKKMKHYLDTVQFGNKYVDSTGNYFDNGKLLVTPDEMVGFMKDFYHGELAAFDQRSIQLVQDLMLQEVQPYTHSRLFYRCATVPAGDSSMHWIVGFVEHKEYLRDPKTKKMEHIPHPYFFAMNFVAKNNTQDWKSISVTILKNILKADYVEK